VAEFKERVRLLRDAYKLSPSQLGAAMNKSEGAVRSWETGKAKPDCDTLIKLAAYFNCSTDYLLGLSEFKSVQDKEDKEHAFHEGLSSFGMIYNYLDRHDYEGVIGILADAVALALRFEKDSDFTGKYLEALDAFIGSIYSFASMRTMQLPDDNDGETVISAAYSKFLSELIANGDSMRYAHGKLHFAITEYIDKHIPSANDKYLEQIQNRFSLRRHAKGAAVNEQTAADV